MAEKAKKSNRLMRVLLVVSLALNLAIAGVVVGVMSKGGPSGAARFDLTAGPIMRAMSKADRDALRGALRDSGVFRPDDRAAMRADMDALVSVLRDESFDGAAFRDVFQRQRARLQSGQDRVVEAVSAQIATMSGTQRAAFADRLEEQLRRGPPPRAEREDRSGG